MDSEQQTDIFLWANNIDAIKNDLEVELFLFSKHYTPFQMNLTSDVEQQLKPLFLLEYVGEVQIGAGTGMMVRDYELAEKEENTLLKTELEKVRHAHTLIEMIEKQRSEVVMFSEDEHEFRHMKGMLVRFFHRESGKVFYTVKGLPSGAITKKASAWEYRDGAFRPFGAEVAFKLPSDNQVLIVDGEIYVFAQSKFERLFQYEYKKQLLADKKVEEIEKAYKLSFSGENTLQSMVMERRKVVNKLQKLEVGLVSQEQVLEYADEMQLELMADDAGAIIILDGNDLDMFVNLINEDYITTAIGGRRYEIKSKKLLDEPEGEAPRGI